MNKLITITLIAMISVFYFGCDKEKDEEKIEESTEIPIANFHASPQYGPAPLTVKFSDQSLHRPTSWLWTLGDNSTSTAQNPTRTYNEEGTYSVTLSVTNGIGSDTKLNTNYIEVGPSNTPPRALFKISPSGGTINTVFGFDASSSTDDYDPDENLLVRWDFEGNGTWDTDWDTEKVLNHQFSNGAKYYVTLEVKDSKGLIDQSVQSFEVSGNAYPNARFTITPSVGFVNSIFTFNALTSTDDDLLSNLQMRWDFDGDGTWDTEWDTNKTASHQYGSGDTYSVKLEVKDKEGLTDQDIKNVSVYSGCGGESNFTYEGQTYEIVEIGYQCWMAENLNYETPNSWWYDNSSVNGDVYGRLYTWEAAMEACPDGWRLPSDQDYKILEMTHGMSLMNVNKRNWRGINEGEKMKSASGWNNDGNGTNASGFNGLPGGYRRNSGSFNYYIDKGYWWSSTEESESRARYRHLQYNRDQVYRNDYDKMYGLSVRCVKD